MTHKMFSGLVSWFNSRPFSHSQDQVMACKWPDKALHRDCGTGLLTDAVAAGFGGWCGLGLPSLGSSHTLDRLCLPRCAQMLQVPCACALLRQGTAEIAATFGLLVFGAPTAVGRRLLLPLVVTRSASVWGSCRSWLLLLPGAILNNV